ncbi:MAG: hypothetical protein HN353_01495 [Bdellovibrionales bacterium]|mgnify:FL=1|jgi:myo-inositol catabolism protein IolS|nr:hypothetical protein [Bdellovibrionales bacterium]MBT3525445.1 hypothetical protein [Bdellovibrionales bacterium]MBT7766885.1 hypothetical protein [Bdellovibrionales bacterium]
MSPLPTLLTRHSQLPIGFGGASISGEGGGYGFGEISSDRAVTLLLHAVELGVTIFDTAPVYGFGESERRIGKAFANCRDQVFIVSKCGVDWHKSQRINMTNDPQVAAKMLEESRQRLDSDYIDLYMIHWPDKRVDIRRPMELLAKAKERGQIRHIGLSNTNADDLSAALEIAPVEAIQQEHNLFAPTTATALTKMIEKQRISVMGYGTFDKGILTGRVTPQRQFDATDLRSWAPWWKNSRPDHRVKKAEKLLPILAEHQVGAVSFALSYNRFIRQVEISLCGVRNIEQLQSTLTALEQSPTEATINSILQQYEQSDNS